MHNVEKTLGKWVKKKRLERGWSQNELSERMKVCMRTVMDIERGESNPKLETLRMLTSVLEIPMQIVFYGEAASIDTRLDEIIIELASFTQEEQDMMYAAWKGMLQSLKTAKDKRNDE